jgi:hypothetical protein
MAESKWRTALTALFHKHRRRLATLVLVVFLAIVAIQISGAIPREMRLAFPLGPMHSEVTEAHIAYLSGEEQVQSVTLRWPDGAPALVRQTLDLTPGEYEVSITLVERDGSARHLSGRVSAPSDGVVQVALHDG